MLDRRKIERRMGKQRRNREREEEWWGDDGKEIESRTGE